MDQTRKEQFIFIEEVQILRLKVRQTQSLRLPYILAYKPRIFGQAFNYEIGGAWKIKLFLEPKV